MTRKDYILIAATFQTEYRNAKLALELAEDGSNTFIEGGRVIAIIQTAGELADALQRDNPHFNRDHFLAVIRGEKALASRPSRKAVRQ